MRLLPHEVLRARRRRGPLIALTWLSLLSLVMAVWAPPLQAFLGTPRVPALLAALAATLIASFAAVRGVRVAGWSVVDDVAWVVALGSMAVLTGAARAPVGAHALLYALALTTLALRDPSGSMVIFACATTALALVVRAIVAPGPAGMLPLICVAMAAGFGFMSLVLQTRRLVRVLGERDAFRAALHQAQQGATPAAEDTEPSQPSSSTGKPMPALSRVVARFFSDSNKDGDDPELESWEAVVARLRSTITIVAENAGVQATFEAETRGLAPPSDKVKNHLVRIAEEAASSTLKHGGGTALNFRLMRGEGGVVIELEDDGDANESARSKRAITPLRARLAAIGGTAEVKRADRGWITRVRVPHDQLN